MKFWIIIFFALLAIQLNSCFGGCPTREVTQQVSEFESYSVTVVSPPDPEFTYQEDPANPTQFGSFEVTEGYINPNKTIPSNIVSYQFFFRRTALPGGQDIFDQTAGEVFTIPETQYDGKDVIYVEFAPETPDYVPTSYSGTVRITDPNHVQFELTFFNGDQLRIINSVFFFQTATFDSPIGECEP
ncbi:hypothetical protein FBR05_05020 [Deltaproteobacteria bacterium PRO3]|nr:hypothetical protein [Deltaproteobacteria bacterium PRO3]